MCTITNGAVRLCYWANRGRNRREVLPLLLTTNMRPSEIERYLRRRPDGTRVLAKAVYTIRKQAQLRGCIPEGQRLCPDCPEDKPTPTPLGGRCAACQERHQVRRRKREAKGIPSRVTDSLPPAPLVGPRFPLGTVWYAEPRPSTVPLPLAQYQEPPARVERAPSFSRARCEVAAWSRPASPMEGVSL
jgi:hypothetical protein